MAAFADDAPGISPRVKEKRQMETAIKGLIALIGIVVLLRLIALASKIAIVVGFAAVLAGVWFYPAEAYTMVHTLEREALKLIRMVG